jgi:hypothetical protein
VTQRKFKNGFDLISTWLKPGDREAEGELKPFKRFRYWREIYLAWLKPGAN